MNSIRNVLKLEEAGMLLIGCLAWQQLQLDWWMFFALFLLPDLGMLGYLRAPATGAFTYNLFHHKGLAAAVFAVGYVAGAISLEAAGVILFSHSSFDRMLGYGLKYSDSFQHTHLGMIGKSAMQPYEKSV